MYDQYSKLKYIELSYGNKLFLCVYEMYGKEACN